MARSRRGPENLWSEPCFKSCGDTIRRAVTRTGRFTTLPELAGEADLARTPVLREATPVGPLSAQLRHPPLRSGGANLLLGARRWAGRTAAIDRFCSLMGQGREALRGVDAFGCLRSLRARSALDGVSWVQGGSVEIAVSRWLAACNRIGAVVCSLPRASLLAGARFGLLSPGMRGLRSIRTPSHLAASHA